MPQTRDILAAEIAHQHHHLGDRLVEEDRRGIVIEGTILGGRESLAAPRRPADGDGKEILESGANLDADEIAGGARMVEIGGQHARRVCRQDAALREVMTTPVWRRDRQFAGNAGAADRGDIERDPSAALHFGGDMIGQGEERAVARGKALGDHQDIDRRFQGLAEAVDCPTDAGGTHAKQ